VLTVMRRSNTRRAKPGTPGASRHSFARALCQGDRIRIDDPQNNLQVKILHRLPGGNNFFGNPQIKEREGIVNSFRAHKARGRKHAVSRASGIGLFIS